MIGARVDPSVIMIRLWRALKASANFVLEVIPPYRWIEGRLEVKEIGRDGTYYLLVDTEIIEVDWLTFETVMVGEALRARCTRSNKAISIDRLVPGGNGGN